MSALWDRVLQCAEGAAAGTGAGSLAGPAGAVAGGVVGCIAATDDPAGTARQLGHELGGAWRSAGRALDDLFDDDGQPKRATHPTLEEALLRTAGHLEHRGRWSLEICATGDSKATAADYLAGKCTKWVSTQTITGWTWHAANRRALLGEAGEATSAELLYKGLAVEFARRRQLGDRSAPEVLLLSAATGYGAFLAGRYPSGQLDEANGSIEQWRARPRPAGFVPVDTAAPASTTSAWPWALGAVAAVAAVAGVIVGVTR